MSFLPFGFGVVLICFAILGFIDPMRHSYGIKVAPVLALGGVGICSQVIILFHSVDHKPMIVARTVLVLIATLWGIASLPGMILDVKIGLTREYQNRIRNKKP